MATYSDFITQVRAEIGDYGMLQSESADGDGTSTIFRLQNPKILEGSMILKISGVTKTEGTDYTIDEDTGDVTMTTAPASGSDNITFSYKQVNATDADIIAMTNNVIDRLRRKLFVEVIDESTITSVANQVDYSLSTLGSFDIIRLVNVEYRIDSSSQRRALNSETNVVFYKDLEKLHIRPALSTSGYAFRFRFLRAYVKGVTTSGTFEVQDEYWGVILKYVKSEYLFRRAMEATKALGAISKEKTFEPISELMRLARFTREEADVLLASVKPTMPSSAIASALYGISI